MKKLIAVLFLGVALNAQTLVVGHIACKKEQWLNDTLVFGENRDQASLKSYLKMQRCFFVREPLNVKVLNEQANSVEFFYLGNKYWAVPDALQ